MVNLKGKPHLKQEATTQFQLFEAKWECETGVSNQNLWEELKKKKNLFYVGSLDFKYWQLILKCSRLIPYLKMGSCRPGQKGDETCSKQFSNFATR